MPVSELEGAGSAHGLHVEKVGTNVVLRRPDDDENERRFLASVPPSPGSSSVLATGAALRSPDFLTALSEACRVAARDGELRGPLRVWIAVSGLTGHGADGVPVAQRLANDTAVEVVVPDGPLTFAPGGALFSPSPGGWVRFSRDAAEPAFALRHPTPPWESALPKGTTGARGVVLEHIPAGLLARPEGSASTGGGVAVPQAPHPRVLVEQGDATSPMDPAALAAAVAHLHPEVRGQLEFVPATPRALPLGHGHRLARALGQDVVLASGFVLRDAHGERTTVHDEVSGASWQPFPRALRCSPDGSVQVVAASPPPAGWVPADATSYRPAQGPGEVLARVIPAGLALCPGIPTGPTTADRFAFEPHQMSVVLGDPSVPVPPAMPPALRSLVAGLQPGQRSRCRLLVLGSVDDQRRAELVSAAGDLAERLRFLEAPEPAKPIPGPNTGSSTGTGTAGAAGPTPPAEPAPPAQPTPPAQPAPQPAQQPAASLPPLPASRPPTVGEPPAALRQQAPTAVPREPVPSSPEHVPPQDPAEGSPAGTGVVPTELADDAVEPTHTSTREERASFAEAAGAEFAESLPSVNSALAHFPALRERSDDNAKADFVAVRFYLGHGGYGASATNRMLREGNGEAVRDYVACLTSGLRRMPVHRGAAFRMSRRPEAAASYEVGAVLVEPGFLSASSECDLRIEQDHLDVVIWSHSARRLGAFGSSGLPGEVVFTASTRFKVLAADDEQDAPAPAVLMRELRPGEESAPGALDETDESVLPRLRRALGRRRAATSRVLDEPDQLLRLTDPVGLVARQPGETTRTLTAAAGAAPAS